MRAVAARAEEFRRDLGAAHIFMVSSGTAALTLALEAIGSLSQRRDVIVPAYTCFSVPAAVIKAGLRPVLCDVSPVTLDYDHAQLETLMTDRTLCVVAHHLFGMPADLHRIEAICRRRGAFLVEDAAQALGIRQNGRALATIGDVGILSFGRGKQVTCGSGGAIATCSDRIASTIASRYRDLPRPTGLETITDFASLALLAMFVRPSLYWIPSALPSLRLGETVYPREIRIRRMSGLKAGALRNWRAHLMRSNRVRSRTADYFRLRAGLGLATPSHPYLRVPVLASTPAQKQRLQALSKRFGLGMSAAYPAAVSDIPELRPYLDGRQFPAAAALAERLLTLPTHQWLREKDKATLATVCREGCAA